MDRGWVNFRAPALANAAFEVLRLQGEERLNHLPVLSVDIQTLVPGTDAYRRLLSTDVVSLEFEEEGKVLRSFHGLVVDVELVHPPLEAEGKERGSSFARVRIAPRLWLLGQNFGSEIFINATYPEIIRQKLEAVGLEPDRDYRFAISETHPRRELTVQYQETDLAFVQRLCEHSGLITRFEYTGKHDRWLITDVPTSLAADEGRLPIPVRTQADHPAAYGVVTRLQRSAQSVTIHDYNYRAPRLALLQESDGTAEAKLGRRVEYGAHTKDPAEARRISAVRQQALAARAEVVTGGCSAMYLEVGQRLVLDHAELGTMELMIVALEHRSREHDGHRGLDTRFEAIPAGTSFRPPRITPWPRVEGLINARVDGQIKGHYAELDEAGRYHVQMAFDRSGRTNRQASHPVRMAQPHAGAHYGMHFPLRPGAEVLLGFVDGNPDRPLIVGTAPNPENASPVDADNYSQNILRTKSGNELVIEDELGRERVRIHSPHSASTLQLGSVDEPEEGILLQTEGHISHACRGTHNVASRAEAHLTGQSVTMATEHAVCLAGLAAAA
ncbi:MAG: type VI secretion system tip protein TssI/VgrG, partial [Myxococcota bacterium]